MSHKLAALLNAPLLVLTGASVAFALDCIEYEFDTERLPLELQSVTVDGAPLESTDSYEGFNVVVENQSDYEGNTVGMEFRAFEKDTDDGEAFPTYAEYYRAN